MLTPDFSPFPEIKTDRLLLRRMTVADAPQLLLLRSDENVMKYIGREKMKTLEEAEGFIQKISASVDSNESIMWAITLQDAPGTMIGTICYWNIQNQHYRAEVGYILHPSHWNRGIMKEALLSVIEYGFKIMKLHSIEAQINPVNVASGIVLEKTGFTKEAYFKEAFYFAGEFSDTAVYSLLKK